MHPASSRAQHRTGESLSSMGAPTMLVWKEFCESFKSYDIPSDVVELKQDEFRALKQGSMTVHGYRDKFAHLSCYDPHEVSDDAKK